MKINTIITGGLLIAFFLPWIDLTIFTLSGYNIPTSLDKLAYTLSFIDDNNNSDILKISYFLYLIPVISVVNIIRDFAGYKNSYLINEYLFGILASIMLFIIVINTDALSTSILGIGFYLTFIFSVIGTILNGINFNLDENKAIEFKKDIVQDFKPEIDKPKLLEQLSLLHSLKEKGALSDEIYEQERQEILSVLLKPIVLENANQIEVEEQNTTSDEEYKLEYEKLFGKETWFKKNKTWMLVSVLVVLICIIIYYFYI